MVLVEITPTSAWRLVAECHAFTRTKPVISVGGLNPWDCDWVPLDEPEIVIPDHTLRSRSRWLRVYEIGRAQSRVKFASCLVENTFGFYLPASPDAPGSINATTAEHEGHWRRSAEEASALPWPIPAPEWSGRTAFLSWLDKLEATAARITYRGKSLCRLCRCINGHEAFRLHCWEWPTGYRHYIAEHLVRPSEQFERFVKGELETASLT
jgi:hypothetical protein